MMNDIGMFVALAVCIESAVEALVDLPFVQKALSPKSAKRILGIVLGVGACYAFDVEIISCVMPEAVLNGGKFLAFVITGLLLSRGSNVFHDIIKRFEIAKTNAKNNLKKGEL